jgi:hypothetical protein
MRTKINITSEIISPLGNLELFQEQIQQGIPTILPQQNRMKMLSIMLRKEKKSFRLTKKLALRMLYVILKHNITKN